MRIRRLEDRVGLSLPQQRVFDAIVASRGGVRGPFPILLHTPDVAAGAEQIGGYLRQKARLGAAARESAVLVTAVLFDSEVEWSSHAVLARDAGVGDEAIGQIRQLRIEGLSGEVGLAAEFAVALVSRNRVSPDLYARCRSRWDEEQLVELACTIGYYSFLAIVMNAFDEGDGPRIREWKSNARR